MGKRIEPGYLVERLDSALRGSFEASSVVLGTGRPCDLELVDDTLRLTFEERPYLLTFERGFFPQGSGVFFSILSAGTGESAIPLIEGEISSNYDSKNRGERGKFRRVFGFPPGRPIGAFESHFKVKYDRDSFNDDTYSGVRVVVPLMEIPLGKRGVVVSEKLFRAIRTDLISPIHRASKASYSS